MSQDLVGMFSIPSESFEKGEYYLQIILKGLNQSGGSTVDFGSFGLMFTPQIEPGGDWMFADLQSLALLKALIVNRENAIKSQFESTLDEKIDCDVPVLTGSILDYAVSLPVGLHFARHDAEVGTDKPEVNKRYAYQIMKHTSATITLVTYEGQEVDSNAIYMKNYTLDTWGAWIKFTGTAVT